MSKAAMQTRATVMKTTRLAPVALRSTSPSLVSPWVRTRLPTANFERSLNAADIRRPADASLRPYAPGRQTTECNDGVPLWRTVGHFLPNAFGIYDMTGNAWEWLQDCYRDSYRENPRDGSAFEATWCPARSIRGGSMFYDLPSLRSADRSDDPPETLWDGIGFRVARDLSPSEHLTAD